jgi:hypothetical protein
MNVFCGGRLRAIDSGPIEHRMIRLRWQSCIIDGEAVACDDTDPQIGLSPRVPKHALVRRFNVFAGCPVSVQRGDDGLVERIFLSFIKAGGM